MTRLCYTDLETRSSVNLRSVGSKAYIKHPDTAMLSCAFLLDDVIHLWVPPGNGPEGIFTDWKPESEYPVEVWRGEDPPHAIRAAIAENVPFVAHNAESFDAIAWEKFCPGPQPRWIDSIHLCRAAGYPAALDRVSRTLGLGGKDEMGAEALKVLWSFRPGHPPHVGTVAIWRLMLRYNIRDVVLMKQLLDSLPPSTELNVIEVSERINRRGIPVDVAFAQTVEKLWEGVQDEARDVIEELTDGSIKVEDARSVPKMRKWLAEMGKPVATLRKEEITKLLKGEYFGDTTNDPVAARIEGVILARQLAARSTVGKVRKVYSVKDDDDRVRRWAVYHGAHTGRFSARDLQPHNMARGGKIDLDYVFAQYRANGTLTHEDMRVAIERGFDPTKDAAPCSMGDAVGTLMRPIVRAKPGKRLVVCDYAQVECRKLMWLARDQVGLAAFRDVHADIYLEMACGIYGREIKNKGEERQVGKVTVLGCGYQMSGEKMQGYCEGQGIDLTKAGTTGDQCVAAFRNKFDKVPVLWRAMQNAAKYAVASKGHAAASKFKFRMHGHDLAMTLPSGRVIWYRNARIEQKKFGPTLVFEHPRGYPCDTYGGKLTENGDQGSCADFLRDALLKVDPVYSIVMHVHDEIVCEVDEDRATEAMHWIARTMSIPPAWAEGMPLRVEAFVADHYTKGALKGFARCEYMLGKELL